MSEHKMMAENLIDLLDLNEDNTTNPNVLAMMAHTHAMIALIETVEKLTPHAE